jgi:hypothetical protein
MNKYRIAGEALSRIAKTTNRFGEELSDKQAQNRIKNVNLHNSLDPIKKHLADNDLNWSTLMSAVGKHPSFRKLNRAERNKRLISMFDEDPDNFLSGFGLG